MLASSGEITAPCRVPFSLTVTTPSSRTPSLEPFADQANDALGRTNPMLHKTYEPLLVHRIEQSGPDVSVRRMKFTFRL